MNNLYHFVRDTHILVSIEEAIIRESTTLNLSHNFINEIPNCLASCTCLLRLFLHNNKILQVLHAVLPYKNMSKLKNELLFSGPTIYCVVN